MTGRSKRSKESVLGTERSRAPYTPHACKFCRIRKIKCDGTRPTCASYDRSGDECTWGSSSTQRTVTLRHLQEHLEKRIDVLEGVVASLAPLAQRQEMHAGPSKSHVSLQSAPPLPVLPLPNTVPKEETVGMSWSHGSNSNLGMVGPIMQIVEHLVEQRWKALSGSYASTSGRSMSGETALESTQAILQAYSNEGNSRLSSSLHQPMQSAPFHTKFARFADLGNTQLQVDPLLNFQDACSNNLRLVGGENPSYTATSSQQLTPPLTIMIEEYPGHPNGNFPWPTLQTHEGMNHQF